MPTNFPASLDNFGTVPTSQNTAPLHRDRHQNVEDAIEAIEAVVGTTGASDGSLTGQINRLKDDDFGLGLLLNGTAAGAAIDQLRTGQHFTQNGARIHRLNDRLFIAAATDNDGAFPNVNRDWMSDYWVGGGFGTGPMASAIFGLANDTNPNSAIGVLSAVRSANFTSAGTTAIGGFSCVFNDHASLATKAYGHYIEAHRTTASPADTYGLEIDTRTLKATLQPTPRQLGDVAALQIASGAEWSASGQFDASCAIQIAKNPMRFKVGINFMHDSLVDIGGGITEAIGMNRYSLISWFDSTGTRSGYVTSSATTAAGGTAMDLAQNQVNLSTAAGTLISAFVHTPSAVNYLALYNSVAGAQVRILAGGTDPNIDLSIEPKGTTGRVRFGTASTAATTPASFSAARYLPIKDSSGTVYYLPLATATW